MTYFQVVPGAEVESAHMNTAIDQGAIPFPSAAARAAAIPAPHNGMLTWLADVRRYEYYLSPSWRPIADVIGLAGFRVKVGNVVATTNVNGVITVPFGMTFSTAPVVVFSPGDLPGIVESQSLSLIQANLTTTQFMAAEFIKVAGSPVRIHYIAIGPAPAPAADREAEPLVTYEYMPDGMEPYPAPSDEVAP